MKDKNVLTQKVYKDTKNIRDGMIRKEKLLVEVQKQLFLYPQLSRKTKCKRVVLRLTGRKCRPIDHYFWPNAMLAIAAMNAHKATGEQQYLELLSNYMNEWIADGRKIYYIDNAMLGEVFYYVGQQTGNQEQQQAADKLMNYVTEYAKNCDREYQKRYGHESDGSLPYRKKDLTWIYADGLGMVCPSLMQIGTAEKKGEYTSLAIKQMRNFLSFGMDEATGLPYHGYDMLTHEKQGIIGWGRAVGWLMMAMSGMLSCLTEEQADIAEAFEALVRSVLLYQRPDGFYSWQLEAMEGPADSSATAMITYALKQSLFMLEDSEFNHSELSEYRQEIQTAIGRATEALLSVADENGVGQCLAECEGYAQYPQAYGRYPWSLGMTVAVLCMEQ